MNVAVIITCQLNSGGFQYELRCAQILSQFNNINNTFHFFTTRRNNVDILQSHGIPCIHVSSSIGGKIFRVIKKRKSIFNRLLVKFGCNCTDLERCLKNFNIDITYFLAPSPLAFDLVKSNFIFTVWDLCHRDYPEFPEVNFENEFESREKIYRWLPKAIAILVDSETSKRNIIRRYHVDEQRIYVAPFLPLEIYDSLGEPFDIVNKYKIKTPYIFYPAQFWPHKNHIYILEALKILKDEHKLAIYAVFSGYDKGNKKYILSKAQELGIAEQIYYIGFIPSDEIPHLYLSALSLVMPTYFGPTNIPPLEAFSLGCPVCYPDLPGLRDHISGAAFLIDLNDPATLAHQLLKIKSDSQAVMQYTERGRQVLASWSKYDYFQIINHILEDYKIKLKCWK